MKEVMAATHERRQFQRNALVTNIEIRVAKYREVFEFGNISLGGLFIATGDRPQLPVRTIVCVTEEGKETVLGRVVWVNEDGMGIEFLEQPPKFCDQPCCSQDS